jgi:hypothetical protein
LEQDVSYGTSSTIYFTALREGHWDMYELSDLGMSGADRSRSKHFIQRRVLQIRLAQYLRTYSMYASVFRPAHAGGRVPIYHYQPRCVLNNQKNAPSAVYKTVPNNVAYKLAIDQYAIRITNCRDAHPRMNHLAASARSALTRLLSRVRSAYKSRLYRAEKSCKPSSTRRLGEKENKQFQTLPAGYRQNARYGFGEGPRLHRTVLTELYAPALGVERHLM